MHSSSRRNSPICGSPNLWSLAAGVLWLLVALAWQEAGLHGADEVLRHNLVEYGELLLFLLAAMTFVNTLEERHVFAALRSALVERRFSFRAMFWLTGAITFVLSPILDNLTTALVMGAVVLAAAREMPRFITPACINIVVAANAGGAFSPFGDITTLMVWQKGLLGFFEFFALSHPVARELADTSDLMSFTIPAGQPPPDEQRARIKSGGVAVIVLFALTIAATVAFHQFAHLPPFLGMMTGLGALQILGYVIRQRELRESAAQPQVAPPGFKPATKPFDIFISVKRVEWDTLLFFYGVVLCVGALGAFGFLALLSQASYASLGDTWSNIAVGHCFGTRRQHSDHVCRAHHESRHVPGPMAARHAHRRRWRSLLSIGSAAGVALMGQARGIYTFFAHLKWTWAIALGYAASIYVHFLVNAKQF